jgi:hypothetical protein
VFERREGVSEVREGGEKLVCALHLIVLGLVRAERERRVNEEGTNYEIAITEWR